MEPLTAVYPVCTHIKTDGVRCGSPALTGGNFCFQHIGGRIPSARARATTCGANAKLKLVYPGDREAIQHNLFLVAQALNDGKIDHTTANTFNRIFRTCELNLRHWEKARESDSDHRMLPLRDETPEANDQHAFDLSSRPKSASPGPPAHAGFARWGGSADAAEGPAVSSSQSSEIDNEYHEVKGPLTDDDETMLADLFPDAIARYKAAYAARVQTAIDAGLEPPVYEPWHLGKFESKTAQQEREDRVRAVSAATAG